jgi:hypothetical protein
VLLAVGIAENGILQQETSLGLIGRFGEALIHP